MNRGIFLTCLTGLQVIPACSSTPKTIPLAQTRALIAANPALGALEQQIATKKAEQDELELRRYELAEKIAQSPKDKTLQQQLDPWRKKALSAKRSLLHSSAATSCRPRAFCSGAISLSARNWS